MISTGQAKDALPHPFIDSDDLKDLDKLFDYVGSDTANFLVIGSKEVLLRPCCVGEIVTAQATCKIFEAFASYEVASSADDAGELQSNFCFCIGLRNG